MSFNVEFDELASAEGHSLSALGIDECAFSRGGALRAVDALRKARQPIFGGDVYRLVGNQPVSSGDSWHTDPAAGESSAEFAERSAVAALEYIEAYCGATDVDSVWFTLVF